MHRRNKGARKGPGGALGTPNKVQNGDNKEQNCGEKDQQDFTFFKVKLSKKILKLQKLINKILNPYSFLCLEFMAYKKEKILAPFL